ncbi:Transcriptional regulator, TetR family protein [Minicystis rosea]|nr:Transcriptional regulator, TetR family protein [Minicystis rosea]
MARPVSIKDETIIAAAREVFLERGIQATTAEVAQRAGVSEGSVFKRFKSKVELFRAAMEDQLHQPDWVRELSSRVGKSDVRDHLQAIGLEMIAFFRELMPLMMMSWSNPAPNGLPAAIAGPNPPPVRVMKSLTGYFEAEMRAGRIRSQDPEIVARTFLGAINNFVFFELLLRANGELPMAAETYVRGIVSLLWTGIEPSPNAATRPRGPRA